MSTQHPDNVITPFFSESTDFEGEDEIKEAYYAFSHLGIDEQMWDCEGKEIDNYVVKKLLTKYSPYFKEYRLGKDKFITLRVPNPTVEKSEAKILLETLESIPRSFDASKLFYGDDTPPIFEVILPMTTSSKCLERIYRYYFEFVIGKKNKLFMEGDITIGDWIGEFKPENINVIPLFEDMEHMLDAHNITRQYLHGKHLKYQRVFLARSDPAANYGNISAVLLNKIALYKLHLLAGDTGIDICPIIGVGSAPFRGNLRPGTVERVIKEYPSVQTFTIQSAFKYDNHPNDVREGVRILNEIRPAKAHEFDEKRSLEIVRKYTQEYQKQLSDLAPTINLIARYVPSRRKRKLHIGLFGYSRNIGGVKLPRAITLTSALYSIGLPPEILGLNALDTDDLQFIRKVYVNFENDLNDAIKYLNIDTPFIPKILKSKLEEFSFASATDKEHKETTDYLIRALKDDNLSDLREYILKAASIRNFLG
ncbi:MAG: phosphoenolpyruvate carboxylase [Caldithrix sp. RBG_13_44_9]|nr:MAG: phosphoenolpyruvate carboxylase [Caldithrix sp. RBG_13_44_9]